MTRNERESQIHQMLLNQQFEGIEADESDKLLFQKYIDGTISLGNLMQTAQAYGEWLRRPRDIVETLKKLSVEEKIELHRQAIGG